MHKSRLGALVIDCKVDDIEKANRFWEAALGNECVRSGEALLSKYSSLNTDKSQPHILIQKVTHEIRVHIDIDSDDIKAEVNRLQALGATIVSVFERWVVMASLTGHNFCVVSPQRNDFEIANNVNRWS